jgi:hypothetical protein
MLIRVEGRSNARAKAKKRIFAILSRDITPIGKTIRQIIICDNHPASLRLLVTIARASSRPPKIADVVLTVASLLAIGLGMFWPLL